MAQMRWRACALAALLAVAGCQPSVPARGPAGPSAPQLSVYFSPDGGCTDAIVREIAGARRELLIQAYGFSSAPIAKAVVDAHRRGVAVTAVLDASNETQRYSSATFLANAGVPALIDDAHAIAHNKVMIMDGETILTGSFNFTKAAEERNAENLLVIKGAPDLAKAYRANFKLHAGHSHAYQRASR